MAAAVVDAPASERTKEMRALEEQTRNQNETKIELKREALIIIVHMYSYGNVHASTLSAFSFPLTHTLAVYSSVMSRHLRERIDRFNSLSIVPLLHVPPSPIFVFFFVCFHSDEKWVRNEINHSEQHTHTLTHISSFTANGEIFNSLYGPIQIKFNGLRRMKRTRIIEEHCMQREARGRSRA